jgi:hypothetical protein
MTTISVSPDDDILGMMSRKRCGAGISSPRLQVSETPDRLAKAQRNLCRPRIAFAFSNGARKEDKLSSEKPSKRRMAITAPSSRSTAILVDADV